MFLLLPTIYLSWMLWWIPQKQGQWSHSGVPPLSILFHVLLEYWYLDHCNKPWLEVTLSLPPTLQLTAACWQLISSEQWTYTSGLLGMKGTLFLRVHSAIFFIQQPWTSICSNIPFWIFFSTLADFVPPALKRPAVLFVSFWRTSAFNSFLE